MVLYLITNNKMNWRDKLSDVLSQRKIDNNIDYNNIDEIARYIIYPTLLDIKNELQIWYNIKTDISNNILLVYFGESGYWFKFETRVDILKKLQVTAYIVDLDDPNLEPGVQPLLKISYHKSVESHVLNSTKLANMFYESFQVMLKFYTKVELDNQRIQD